MKSFKKILTGIGVLGIAVPASFSVIACQENGENPDGDKALSWDLNAYNDESRNLKIWIEEDKIESILKDSSELTKILWTGIFDADDKDGDHSRQMQRFNDQAVDKHLKINNIVEFGAEILKNASDEKQFVFDKGLSLVLDKDLKSKTDQNNPKDYILKASDAVLKSITVIFINSNQ